MHPSGYSSVGSEATDALEFASDAGGSAVGFHSSRFGSPQLLHFGQGGRNDSSGVSVGGASTASSPMPMQHFASPGIHAFGGGAASPLFGSGSAGGSAFPSSGNQAMFPHLMQQQHQQQADDGWTLPQSPLPFFLQPSATSLASVHSIDTHAHQQHQQQSQQHHPHPQAHHQYHVQDLHPHYASPQFSAMQSPDPLSGLFPSVNHGGSASAAAQHQHHQQQVRLGLLDLDADDLARDMSFSQGHAPEDEGDFLQDATSYDHPLDTSHPHYPADVNPLETSAQEWEEADTNDGTPAADGAAEEEGDFIRAGNGRGDVDVDGVGTASQEEEGDDDGDEDMVSNKKRKLAAYKDAKMNLAAAAAAAAAASSCAAASTPVAPTPPPSNARVCELGLIHKQVCGHLCWTAYQKVSATDRSCLALLCPAHSDETNVSQGQPRYTQLVPQDRLLQLGLTIEKKSLERILTHLQTTGAMVEHVLVMRIRRAIQGKVKTGPEFCHLLLFPSSAARAAAEAALATHLLPAASKIGFPAALVPFTCDFTKRCVWLVPKQLCIGGQYMVPAEAGALNFAPTPTPTPAAPRARASAQPPASASLSMSLSKSMAASPARASRGATSGLARGGSPVVTKRSAMAKSSAASPSASSSSPSPSSSSSATAAAAAATQLPLFSALSLHAPSSVEDATYLRVISKLTSPATTPTASPVLAAQCKMESTSADGGEHAASSASPSSAHQLTSLEREAIARFKRFPHREPVFDSHSDHQSTATAAVDFVITRATFLQVGLEILLDLTWPDEPTKQKEVQSFAPLLHSLFVLLSLPPSGDGGLHQGQAANASLSFTAWFHLYTWLRPSEGWTKPATTMPTVKEEPGSSGGSGGSSSGGSSGRKSVGGVKLEGGDEMLADGGWSASDLRVSASAHRSAYQSHVVARVHHLLAFLHRSIRFFQAYAKRSATSLQQQQPSHQHQPHPRSLFTTRRQLEADEQFQTFTQKEIAEAATSTAAAAAGDTAMDSSSSDAAASAPPSRLLFHAQVRFSDDHSSSNATSHISPSPPQSSFEGAPSPLRNLLLSYVSCDPRTGVVSPMEHVPLLRDGGDMGYFILHHGAPQSTLNFLTPAQGDESALIEFTRSTHAQLMAARGVKMEGGASA